MHISAVCIASLQMFVDKMNIQVVSALSRSLSLVRARAKQTDRSREGVFALFAWIAAADGIYRTQLQYAHSNMGAEWNRRRYEKSFIPRLGYKLKDKLKVLKHLIPLQ